MSIKQLLESGGSLAEVDKLLDPEFNHFGEHNDVKFPGDGDVEIKDSAGIKTGKYSRDKIQGLVKAAKAVGVDPYQIITLSLQESGIGTAEVKGRRGRHAADLAQINDFSDEQQKQVSDMAKSTGIDPDYLKVAVVLRDKLNYAEHLGFKDPAAKLQAYNGYGTITKEKFGGADKAYGVEIGDGINLKKNPLYGKRVLQLSKDLQGNQSIKQIVSEN